MSSVPPPPPPDSGNPPPPPDSGNPPPQPAATPPPQAAATPPPPPQPAAVPPPPPPPPGPSFDAGGQARALFSQMDPTGWRPTAIVAGVILALFFGSQLLNAVIPVAAVGPGVPGPGPAGPGPVPTTGPGPGPVTTAPPPGSTLTVGPLAMPLQAGWVPQEVPGSGIIVRLVKGGVAIDVFGATLQGQTDAAALYTSYMNELAGDSDSFGATQPTALTIGNGIPAARGVYTGVFGDSQVEGQVTTLGLGTDGFIFDVWAGSGTLQSLLPEAQQMIDNLRVQ